MLECFEKLEDEHSTETVQKARGLRLMLQDKEFNFWLAFFHRIMPHVDIQFQQIQSRQMDSLCMRKAVECFVQAVQKVRDDTENISRDVELDDALMSAPKRRRLEDSNSAIAKDVCDIVITHIKYRFEFSEYFDVAKLIDSEYFGKHALCFPEKELNIATMTYRILCNKRLKTELSVLYEKPDFRQIFGALPLFNFILNNNIEDTFQEVTKLLQILITTPMTTAEAERCFSALERIKTFLRNAMCQERLNALAMLSIEKEMIMNMTDFNSKVIEKFVSRKNRRMDFI